ncbi:MAG: hypothetical protein JXB88_11230 [Spirochaetales bacterium]|nr:hypothetical protein [Spirochaetales bacterium]
MEFISLSNLITMGVVVFVLFLYRYLDKNNRSLEKVKRFTDKVKDSLAGFIEEKTQEIRNLSIDMQVNLKTAKEILKRISDIEVELKNKAKSMDALQSKVNEYDTLIQELNNATITVEENLKRIHNESSFIDKVGKRVKTAQTKIEQIEKDIPAIREEIKKKNYEDLKDTRNALTEEVKERIIIIQEEVQGAESRVKDFSIYLTRLEGRRDGMEKELVKKLEVLGKNFETGMLQKKSQVTKSFKEELSGYLLEVNTKRDEFKHSMDELVQGSQIEITDLEDRMLKHLIEYKKDIEQAELNFKQNVSKVVASGKDLEHDIFTELREKIKQDTQKVHGEVEKQLTQFAHEVEVRNSEIITILGKTKQNTEVFKAGMIKKIEKMKNELGTHFVNSKAEIEANISEFIHKNGDTQKVFEAQLQEFIKRSKNGIQVLDSEFSKKIEEVNQGFTVFKNEYARGLKEIDNKVDEEKEQILLSVDEKIKGLEKQCAIRFEQAKKDVEKINGLGDDIQFRIKNIKKDLQECSCDLLGRIDEFKNKFTGDLTIASSEVENAVMKNIDQRITEYETDVTYRFEKLEQVQTDIEVFEQGLREHMELKKEDLKEDFNGFIAQLEERKNEEREYTNNVLNEIRSEIQKLDQEVHGLKEKAYENLSEKLKIFEDEFFADLKERNEAMTGSLDEWQASVKKKMNSIDVQHEEERVKIETQYSEELQAGISLLTEKTKEMFSVFEQKWQETLTAEIDSSKQQMNLITGEYREEMKEIIREIENNFISQRDWISTDFDKYREEMENNLIAQQNMINNDIEKYKEDIKSTIVTIENEFSARKNGLDTDFDTYREEVKTIITEMENNLITQRSKINNDIEKYKEDIKSTIVTIKNEFSTQKNGLDTDFNTYREEVKTIITEMENNLITQQNKINNDIEKYKEDIKSTIITIENNFSARKNGLDTDFDTYREEVKTIITEMENNLITQRSKINTDIEKYKEDIKNTIAMIKNEFSARKSSLDTDIGKYREEVKSIISEVIDTFTSQRDNVNLDIEKYREEVMNIIQEMESDFNARRENVNLNMEKYKEEAKNTIREIEINFTSQRDSVNLDIEKYKEEIRTIIREMENNFTSQQDDLIVKTEDERKALKAEIHSCSNKLLAFEKRLSGQTETILNAFQSEYKQKQDEFTARLRELQGEFELKIKEYKASITDGVTFVANTRDEQKNEIKILEEKIKTLNKQLKEMAEQAITSCDDEFRKLKDDFINQTRGFGENMEKKISGFENAFRMDQEKIKVTHTRLAGKIEEQYKSLSDNLKEIERHQQNFTAQTKIFERADSLKLTLKNELEDIRKDMKILEPVHKKMKILETDLLKMNKLAEDLNSKSSRFNAEKRRIDNMENNFKQLLKISDNIDEKLASATSAYDSLQDIKIKIRELGELGNDVHARYERLEKKKEIIETTTLGVDKNFKLLEDLEKEIKRIEENVKSLPPQVLTLGEEIKFLVKNKTQADEAVEQMNRLNKMMAGIEERTEKLNNARDWLARTETRLESIGKNAQDQLKLLKALIKEDGGNGKNSKGAPRQDKREMIVKLARQGWSSMEISKATNTSVGEIELILELEPKKR